MIGKILAPENDLAFTSKGSARFRGNTSASSIVLLGALLILAACSTGPFGYGGLGDLEAFSFLVRLAVIIVGLALLVAGFAIFQSIIGLIGFLVGGVLGALMAALIVDDNAFIAILGFVLGGLIGASLALFLVYLSIFISGLLFGGALISGAWLGLIGDPPPELIIIIGAILGGIGMIILYRLWIVALTSALGAAMFGLGVGLDPGWWLLFFLGGIAVQYGLAQAIGRGDAARIGYRKPPPREPEIDQPGGADSGLGIPAGNDLRQAEQITAATSEAVQTAYLIAPEGSKTPIHDNTLIGRSSICHYRLSDDKVSRAHARLRYAGGAWYIQDQNSTYGTYVNGQRTSATRLNPGDVIQLGETRLVFQVE